MPSAVQERSSQKSGRSSRMEARADARPGAGGRSSHIEDARPVRWPLVQESRRSSRKRTLVLGRSSSQTRGTLVQKRTFVHAEGGRSSRRGRSSQAENARPARQKWTLVQPGRGR
ncbi:hypothetical protein LR48_Vigan05g151200 [Vigna angularis]|uniref:Uncharacterized protein n=1 Tax=Phaseolus angularis TaxID=3914 RepID=A0A0L9UMV4_PHAAN|nr:hypothetical protein LR48_Vigan05g151200 [Vigna angularis]